MEGRNIATGLVNEEGSPARVWIFHWYKVRPCDSKNVENTAVIGRVANFPSAWEEVDRRGFNHNIDGANSPTGRITFGDLARSYEQPALPKLAATTQQTARHIIDHYLIPRWGRKPPSIFALWTLRTG